MPGVVNSVRSEGEVKRRNERGVRLGLRALKFGPVLILIVLLVVMSLVAPRFASVPNMRNLGVQAGVILILALGQTFVLLTGGIDLSVGSVVSLATVVGAICHVRAGMGTVGVTAAILLVGALVGLLNGLIFVYGKVPHPFVVTLGTQVAFGGLALLIAGGLPVIGMPEPIEAIGQAYFLGVPVSVFLVIVCIAVVAYLTKQTTYGRWVYATGGSLEAALRVGIPTSRILVSVYVLCGVAASVAAILAAGRTGTGDPVVGKGLELNAIAAAIIGGVSFLGGRGNVSGVVAGALVVVVIQNGLNLLGVSPYVQSIVVGIVVIAAVELDVLRGRLETRVRSLQHAGK